MSLQSIINCPLFLAILLSLNGCRLPWTKKDSSSDSRTNISMGRRPDWVNRSSSQYPKERYLSAVGFSGNRTTAEENARVELSRIFRSVVKSRTQTNEEYRQTTSARENDFKNKLNLKNRTTITTEKVIEGSEIVEVFLQEDPKIYYALAVLHREKAGRILRDRILRLDAEMSSLLEKAKPQTDPLKQLRYFKRAMAKMARRDAVNSELRIVNSSGSGVPILPSLEGIKYRVHRILSEELFVAVKAEGLDAEELQVVALESLSAQGFQCASFDPDQTYHLRIEINASLSISERTRTFLDTRWKIRSRLLNKAGKELNSIAPEGGGGYISREQAVRMSKDEMRRVLATALTKQINGYLVGK